MSTQLMPKKSTIPKIPRRKDSFFYIHFDLHPTADDTVLGSGITEENIKELLLRAKPDMIQYDSKGHPGYTGFPTTIGWASPGIVKDSLAIWRKITKELGIGLYIHYSGIWDQKAATENPDWQPINKEGKPYEGNYTSIFSPYGEELLIPQLSDVIKRYELDGAWVDGEAWAAQVDYSETALKAWKKLTGLDTAPTDKTDANWRRWLEFQRDTFEKYVARWVDGVHKACPKAQLGSNWLYSAMAPRPISVGVDFISGDYSANNSVDVARLDARYMSNCGLTWDLLAWGFNWCDYIHYSYKPAVQLKQEAAVVLMQGGSFGVYYVPMRDGTIIPQMISAMEEVGAFCRERKEVSFKSKTVPQAVVLYSSENQFEKSEMIMTNWGLTNEIHAAMSALLESHYSVDVMPEHWLEPRMSEFPLLVLPNTQYIKSDFKQKLMNYLTDGGSVLALGPYAFRLFSDELGVELLGEPASASWHIGTDEGAVNMNGMAQAFNPNSCKVITTRHQTQDISKNGEPVAVYAEVGKGKIIAFAGGITEAFDRGHHYLIRQLIKQYVEILFPNPAVTLTAPPCVEIALRKTAKGKLALHILNTAMAQRASNYISTDWIPEVGPIEVELDCPEKPRRVKWVPEKKSLKWTWMNGKLHIVVPKLHIHGVIVVE